MAKQLELFDQLTLNVLRDFKAAMAKDVEESGLSREELCEQMNLLAERHGVRLVKGTGQNITMATLEKWLNPEDKERVIGTKILPVFLAATGGIRAIQALVAPLGLTVLDKEDAILFKQAKIKQQIAGLNAELRRLEVRFKGLP